MTNDLNSPVAILDKEIAKYPTYTIETFELCDCCGARFGIGYHQACQHHSDAASQPDELPKKLREMLARGSRPRSQAQALHRNLDYSPIGAPRRR